MSKSKELNAVSVFSYEGNDITFKNENGLMINATQMAKPFYKRPANWLNTQQANEFLSELSVARKTVTADLVRVTQGGNPAMQGTWMHEDVALEFARWLSPAFAIWTNDRVKELLTRGVATANDDDETIANAMHILQGRLNASKQRARILEGENELYKEEIKELAPMAEYAEQVLQSTSTFTTTQVAKGLDMSAVRLNQKLKALGVQFFQSGQWFLTSKYQNRGLTRMRVSKYIDLDTGEVKSSQTMVWTEKGRLFIHELRKGGEL